MPTESPENLITLKEYVLAQFAWRDKQFNDYKEDSTNAVKTASAQIDSRLEKLNELRQEVVADRGIYLTRSEYEAKHETLGARFKPIEEKIAGLEKWQNKVIGIGIVLVLLSGLIGALIGKVLSH
jgi:hypothetical protein